MEWSLKNIFFAESGTASVFVYQKKMKLHSDLLYNLLMIDSWLEKCLYRKVLREVYEITSSYKDKPYVLMKN